MLPDCDCACHRDEPFIGETNHDCCGAPWFVRTTLSNNIEESPK